MRRRPPRSPPFPYPPLFESREDTLQKVPSALLADSATTATTADSVSTLRIVPVTTLAEGDEPVVLASHGPLRSEEHTSELQSRQYLVCRLLLEKKKKPHMRL